MMDLMDGFTEQQIRVLASGNMSMVRDMVARAVLAAEQGDNVTTAIEGQLNGLDLDFLSRAFVEIPVTFLAHLIVHVEPGDPIGCWDRLSAHLLLH